MAEKTSPENQLMRAVLLQNLGEDGTSTLKIDNEKLMEQLGVSSSGAAAKRWSRFKKRLVEEGVTVSVPGALHKDFVLMSLKPKGSDVANGASPKKKGGVVSVHAPLREALD